MFSDLLGTTRHTGPIMGQMRDRMAQLQSGTGWQQAFNQTAGATLTAAMPEFRNQLQMTRENAIRRGVSTGDYATSAEGDLTSAFQRNLATAMSGQALGAYESNQGQINDLMGSQLSAQMSIDNSNRNFWSSLLGSGMTAWGMRGMGGK